MLIDFKEWLKKERFQISLTLLAAIIPVVLSSLFINNTSEEIECHCSTACRCSRNITQDITKSENQIKTFLQSITISSNKNASIQSLFIFLSLFILIYNKSIIYKDLDNSYSIKTYLIRKCHIKIIDDNTIDSKFETIKGITKQFFRIWIFVWLFWLALYLGDALFYAIGSHSEASLSNTIYTQVFDFITSTTIYTLYLILTNVTANIKHRRRYDESIWWGIIGWTLCLTFFIICLCLEISGKDAQNVLILTSTLLSVMSAISFLLVLGKLNSLYLQIPQGFMIILYIYGVSQCYNPIKHIADSNTNITIYADFFLPYITLIGKTVLLLTLCWITYNKRFIYYIIHQTVLVEETPQLLKELNRK